jgi:peptidase E
VLQGWEKDFLEELSNNKEMSDKTFVLGSSFNNEMRRNLTVDKLEPTRVSDRITVPRPESPIAGTSRGVIIKKVSIKRKGHFQEPTELSGGGVIIKNVQLKKDPLPPEQFVNIKREANDDPLYINCNIKDEPLEESDVKEEYIEDIEEQLERQVDRHILLFSASTKSSGNYLEFCRDNIYKFLKFQKVSRVLFIPYAQGDHAAFTLMAMKAFMKMGCSFESIHNLADQAKAISDAQAIFVGHGNTFLLLKALHDNKILDLIRERVLYESLPYIGAGCGSTVAGMTIQVSNDMPLVLPSSLKALELVPFNINPHYFHKVISNHF